METIASPKETAGRRSFRVAQQTSSDILQHSPYASKSSRPMLFDPSGTSPLSTSRRGVLYDVSGVMKRVSVDMIGITPPKVALPLPYPFLPVLETEKTSSSNFKSTLTSILGQVPSIALIVMFHLMIGIPFGVSYFPISWSSHVDEATDSEGPFPLPGKEALGIRMFLFSTIIGQLVFTLTSKFPNPIGLQMVENVPFCHELAGIVISHQGYGVDAISTLLVMYGLSSIVVGAVFYLLGKYRLGRVVYFFPTHVLIGCIGGIGVFIAKTGIEVALADMFSIDAVIEKWNLLWVVLVFELVLRILEQVTKDKEGKARYALMSPIYFCMITPIFYLGLAMLGVSISDAEDAGYFFPSLDDDDGTTQDTSSSIFGSIFRDEHLWDMWTVIDFPSISWSAIWESLPTLFALTLFSLIHVPINIPAFALSTSTEADMNNELIAHGYSNMIAGMLGGLQNYMAYTQSILYDRSGGTGKASGITVALVTTLLFFIGPAIAAYIPKCMAGTLLLHVGVDLFLEGVWDSYGKFDFLEYSGIWLIVVVMTAYGMEAAMVAGIIAAVSTYAVQSVAYLSPIRGFMPATTLRSSVLYRKAEAESILNSSIDGRSRILVIQLQGHLFFGNMAHFTESIDYLMSTRDDGEASPPIVVIMDCTLVLGIDSSAAQAMTKLKDSFLRNHQIELCIFVPGSSEGFPTEFKLSAQLTSKGLPEKPKGGTGLEQINEETALLMKAVQTEEHAAHRAEYCGSCVRDSLDEALTLAENAIISRQDPTCLTRDSSGFQQYSNGASYSSPFAERAFLAASLQQIYPAMDDCDAEVLVSLFERETYSKDDYIWQQHESGDSIKLLADGTLISVLENEAGTTETIPKGNMIGELGLLNGDARMSSVICLSDTATVYSMSRQSFENLVQTQPRIARFLDLICIKYLAHRLQHVSNRIFETRCLPI
jgi:SulP family sulfate permease